MKESKTLEFKESITKSFLKTVSAFSNYDGGEIIFGIDDDGNIKGLSIPKALVLILRIESMIILFLCQATVLRLTKQIK